MMCEDTPTIALGSYQGDLECGQVSQGSTEYGVNTLGGVAKEVHYGFIISDGTPAERTVTFSTCGSQFNTILEFFAGSELQDQLASCLMCGICGNHATMTRTLPAGNYSVVVQGFDGANGWYKLEMLCGANNTRPTALLPWSSSEETESLTSRGKVGWVFTIVTAVFVAVGAKNKNWRRQSEIDVEPGVGDDNNQLSAVEVPPPYVATGNNEAIESLPVYELEDSSAPKSSSNPRDTQVPQIEYTVLYADVNLCTSRDQEGAQLKTRTESVLASDDRSSESHDAPPDYCNVVVTTARTTSSV